MIKISVVVPIYNRSCYLQEAIKSILNQDFKEYEVILVDDGSTEVAVGKMLEEYSSKYSIIRVVTLTDHLGAAAARNIGLYNSKGKYVIFLDSDDVFSCNLLKELYEGIIQKDSDICLCNYYVFNSNGEYTFKKFEKIVSYTSFSVSSLEVDELSFFNFSPWNKLIKKSFLEENDILFQKLESANDTFFCAASLIMASKIYYIDSEPLVGWRKDSSESITKTRNPMNYYYAIVHLIHFLEGKNLIDKYYDKIIYLLIVMSKRELCSNSSPKVQKQFYNSVVYFLVNNQIENKKLKYNVDYYIKCFLCFPFEKKWYLMDLHDYYQELSLFWNYICDELKDFKNIFLWGVGERGKTFIKLSIENGLILSGVTDINLMCENIKNENAINELLCSTEYVINKAEAIVASNDYVYDYLIQNVHFDRYVLRLQEYCPISWGLHYE